jgi:hypothetical protein
MPGVLLPEFGGKPFFNQGKNSTFAGSSTYWKGYFESWIRHSFSDESPAKLSGEDILVSIR